MTKKAYLLLPDLSTNSLIQLNRPNKNKNKKRKEKKKEKSTISKT